MSRRQHPLDRMVEPFKAQVETEALGQGFRWYVTLSNEHGDTEFQSGVLLRTPRDNSGWHTFWKQINHQLEWSKCMLTAAPIVRTFTDDLALAISQIRLDRDWWKEEVGIVMTVWNNKALIEAMQTLTTSEFAAVQHLCKKRLMQIP